MTVTQIKVVDRPPTFPEKVVAQIYAFPQKDKGGLEESDLTFVTEDDDQPEAKVVEPRRRPPRPKSASAAETKQYRRHQPTEE